MAIVFYSAPWSSASPVHVALVELGVPHERIDFDLKAKDQKKPEFLRINPNGRVPALSVDGTPMFEALAIMQWLGDRYGVGKGLWPAADSKDRLVAMSWTTWAYVTVGSLLSRLVFNTSDQYDAALRHEGQVPYLKSELRALMTILDEKLAGSPYLLGANYSLADLIVANVVNYGTHVGLPLDEAHGNVKSWLGRCMDRPVYQQVRG